MPRGEHFCLTLWCQTGAQLRLSILRKRFEPRKGVARSFSEWTKRQTFTQCAADVRSGEAAFFSCPDRHVGPWLHFLLGKKFFVHPGEGRVRLFRLLDSVKHPADAERFRRAGRVVNSGATTFNH